jgi:hypothetical protein
MTRYGRPAWQVIAVAAFVATAVLAVTLTRPQLAALTGVAAACQAPGLEARLGVASDPGVVTRVSTAGSARTDVYFTLEFTNISRQTCSLFGYPDVWAYSGGHQIGSPATADTSIRPRTVTLAPGATAHAVLRYTVTASFDAAACRQVTVPELRVYPPRAGGAVLVPMTIPACSRKGPDFLSVQAVQPRAGIPGHPRY